MKPSPFAPDELLLARARRLAGDCPQKHWRVRDSINDALALLSLCTELSGHRDADRAAHWLSEGYRVQGLLRELCDRFELGELTVGGGT